MLEEDLRKFQQTFTTYFEDLQKSVKEMGYSDDQTQVPVAVAIGLVAAAAAAAAAKSLCKNVNQNGVANNSNI